VQELAENTEKIFRVTCRFHCASPVLVPDQAVAAHLFRIAQEAVSNAVRHAKKVRGITLELKAEPGRVVLIVNDDGSGFAPATPPAKGRGMGLRIMQSRAGMIGGTLAIAPGAVGGTCVTLSAPNPVPPQKKSHGRQK
jgi:signal transduction histidine kinase